MGNKGTCKAEACDKEVVGKGYCRRHYRKWQQGGMPKSRYKTCRTEGCRKRQVKGAHCEAHQKVKAVPAGAPAASS